MTTKRNLLKRAIVKYNYFVQCRNRFYRQYMFSISSTTKNKHIYLNKSLRNFNRFDKNVKSLGIFIKRLQCEINKEIDLDLELKNLDDSYLTEEFFRDVDRLVCNK